MRKAVWTTRKVIRHIRKLSLNYFIRKAALASYRAQGIQWQSTIKMVKIISWDEIIKSSNLQPKFRAQRSHDCEHSGRSYRTGRILHWSCIHRLLQRSVQNKDARPTRNQRLRCTSRIYRPLPVRELPFALKSSGGMTEAHFIISLWTALERLYLSELLNSRKLHLNFPPSNVHIFIGNIKLGSSKKALKLLEISIDRRTC